MQGEHAGHGSDCAETQPSIEVRARAACLYEVLEVLGMGLFGFVARAARGDSRTSRPHGGPRKVKPHRLRQASG